MYVSDIEPYMLDWDWKANKKKPDTITTGSRERVAWKCHICGGKWQSQVKERRGCPYCSGFKALPGFNDIGTTNPELLSEWDWEKNVKGPENYTKGSQKKVCWICPKGHSYDMDVRLRAKGYQCPICRNKRLLKGYNDLATVHPEIAAQWDYEKNGGQLPEEFVLSAKKSFWWKCNVCGYEWKTAIANRHRGTGCPACNNVIVQQGKNDLLSQRPELCKEWDYEKNDLRPEQVALYARKKVAWICPKGHEYTAAVSDRTKGAGCPKCQQERKVSFPEKAICYYVSKYFNNVKANYRAEWLGGFELDIYLPDIQVAIEYDGIYGHSTKYGKGRDERKNYACEKQGIKLIRIREKGCAEIVGQYASFQVESSKKFVEGILFALNTVAKITGQKRTYTYQDIDLEEDVGKIYSLVEYTDKENSLMNKAPEVAKMWHPTKNGHLTPESVAVWSSKSVWWLGKCGHEWKSIVSNEAKSGLCPYCVGKRVLQGFNDLAYTNPELAKQWDCEKNGALTPNNITAGSGKKVWWHCEKGHVWQASVVSRNRGNGCPICANRIALKGYNDVTSVPRLYEDWDEERNKPLLAEQVCIGSDRKVWWKCHICGNLWKAGVDDRYHGSMCPLCAKEERSLRVSETYVTKSGSLAEKHAEVLCEWDWEKNKEIDPTKITPGCTKAVWWKCKTCGHSWKAPVAARTRNAGGGCPACGDKVRAASRRRVLLKKVAPLDVTNPEIAAEWDWNKNKEFTPSEITKGSGKKFWWKCAICGCEWEAEVSARTRGYCKCPNCNKKGKENRE